MTCRVTRRAVLALPVVAGTPAAARQRHLSLDGFTLGWSVEFGDVTLRLWAPTTGWFAISLGADPRVNPGRRFQMLAERGGLTVRGQVVQGGMASAAPDTVLTGQEGGLRDGRSHARLSLSPWPGLLPSPALYARLEWSRLRTFTAAPSWQRLVFLPL